MINNIKRDDFNLFDFSIFQDNQDIKFKNKVNILTYFLDFCNWSVTLFEVNNLPSMNKSTKIPQHQFFYVGICTEMEYYLQDLNSETHAIIRRYLTIPLNKSFIIDRETSSLDIPKIKTLILNFIDNFINRKQSTIFQNNFFIMDELSESQNIYRISYPDVSTQNDYLKYIFLNEQYFLYTDNSIIKEYKNHFKLKSETTYDFLFLNIINNEVIKPSTYVILPEVFQFDSENKKILRSSVTFNQTFSIDNFENLSFSGLMFGILNINNDLYLFLKTEDVSINQNKIERFILYPVAHSEIENLYNSDQKVLMNMIKIRYEAHYPFLILENNYVYKPFYLIYEIFSYDELTNYLSFIEKDIKPHNDYFISKTNTIDLLKNPNERLFNEKISTNNLIDCSNSFFNKNPIRCKTPFIIEASLINKHKYYNLITKNINFFYEINQLIPQELTLFDKNINSNHCISFSNEEKLIIYNDKIIGFIQRHNFVCINSDTFYQIINRIKNNDNHNFFIEDLIDNSYLQENQKFLGDYIFFIDDTKVNNKLIIYPNDIQSSFNVIDLLKNIQKTL